jgi:hypothetical protein
MASTTLALGMKRETKSVLRWTGPSVSC